MKIFKICVLAAIVAWACWRPPTREAVASSIEPIASTSHIVNAEDLAIKTVCGHDPGSKECEAAIDRRDKLTRADKKKHQRFVRGMQKLGQDAEDSTLITPSKK